MSPVPSAHRSGAPNTPSPRPAQSARAVQSAPAVQPATSPIPPHLQKPGFRVEQVSTEHHAFPSRGTPIGESTPGPMPKRNTSPVNPTPRQPLNPTAELLKRTIKLPPGHPLAGTLEEQIEENGSERLEDIDTRPCYERDPRYTQVFLPSGFVFYPFKTLGVTYLRGVHQAKINRASQEATMRPIVEAISATLGDGVSAFDLTPPDFFFLMYWHRVNSMPKNPQMIQYTCTNADHVRRTGLPAEDPEHLPPETLELSAIMDNTSLNQRELKDVDWTQWEAMMSQYDLGAERMSDILDFIDLRETAQQEEEAPLDFGEIGVDAGTNEPPSETEKENTEEIEWLAARAGYLNRGPGRDTLTERCDVIRDMPADDIFALESYMKAISNYGVLEHATIKCKDCGALHRVKISVNALTFLP
jgi:hypothetical protein